MSMPAEDVARLRDLMIERGKPVDNVPDDAIRAAIKQQGEDFRTKAPTSAAQAAAIILEGVRDERWRILVGDDAYALDNLVRAAPEDAYEPDFLEQLYVQGHLSWITTR
jgi:hypothetical protein